MLSPHRHEPSDRRAKPINESNCVSGPKDRTYGRTSGVTRWKTSSDSTMPDPPIDRLLPEADHEVLHLLRRPQVQDAGVLAHQQVDDSGREVQPVHRVQ